MKNVTRITAAFDPTTAGLLEKISKETGASQSEIMRRALRFYNENRALEDPATRKKAFAYLDLLSNGEHVILDVDHWLLFLSTIESCPDNEQFWRKHQEIARSHKEQLQSKTHNAEQVLARLETCNFFRISKNSEKDFTLILGSEIPKKFVKVTLEEFFDVLGIKAEMKENLAKINVTIKP
jgi:hypothetical protein